MAKKAINFKSSGAYKRWLAFGHMHPGTFKGKTPVKIAGKPHKVDHAK